VIVAGHQPEYLPYFGFFSKIAHADIFVIVDNIQYVKKNYQNRNRIKTHNGWIWLSVPVITKGRFEQNINEVEINNSENWRHKHLKTISLNYKKAPFFDEYIKLFEDIYSKEWQMLSELNEVIIRRIIKILGIDVKILKGSELGVSGEKTGLLVDICKKTGADTYLSGSGAKDYVVESMIEEHNLNHKYYEFKHPVYSQLHGEFIPNMSIIDLLFNCGDKSKEYIFTTDEYDVFITSQKLAANIYIRKANFLEVVIGVIIIIEPEEIYPGIPTFYYINLTTTLSFFITILIGYLLIRKKNKAKSLQKIKK